MKYKQRLLITDMIIIIKGVMRLRVWFGRSAAGFLCESVIKHL